MWLQNETYEKPQATQEQTQTGQVTVYKGMEQVPDPNYTGDPTNIPMVSAGPALKTKPSMFSPLFQTAAWDGIHTDADFKQHRDDFEPTIARLIGDNDRPGLKYDLNDFLFTSDAENVSGYHMITLRRFGTPINDCLLFNDQPQVDVGRLVTYMTEDQNKLSELMSMTFGMKWKELTADFWTPEVVGSDSGFSGMMGKVFEVMNPMYLKERGLGKNAVDIDLHHDQNRTYGPVDVIDKTHIRDRGLNFNQDIKLTFKYDLKSYDGVNPKQALIDLLANILVVTFNDGHFWGGAQLWRGRQRTAFQNYMSKHDVMSLDTDFKSTMQYYFKTAGSALGVQGGNTLQAILAAGKAALTALQGFALNKLCDTLGRPTVVVANSILNGEPVGNWHVTIGNPYRPILSIGNLILTNTEIKFSDELGIDGFPTQVIVTCTLKHAKPRDRAGIEMMFQAGMQRAYWQPSKAKLKEQLGRSKVYASVKNMDDLKAQLTNEVYSRIGISSPV